MVRVLVSSAAEEIGRRKDGVQDKAAERGFRRLERDDEEAKYDRAISTVGSLRPVSRTLEKLQKSMWVW